MSDIIKSLPTTPDNHLGFEFEVISSHLRRNSNFNAVKAVHPSVRVDWEFLGPCYGNEVTICVPESNYKPFIERLVEEIKAIHEEPAILNGNHSTGIHVHLDVRNRGRTNIRRAVEPLDYTLAAIAAPWRGSGRWLWDRHRYETVECRHMDATFDIPRIFRYIDTLLAAVRGLDNPPPAAAVAA